MLLWKDIPNDQPNKQFYRGKVCRCYEDSSRGHPCSGDYRCGLCQAMYLDICKNCKSVYVWDFNHHYQIEPILKRGFATFPYSLYCWHCLEAGVSKRVNPARVRFGKKPPLLELLNPKIEPPNMEDRMVRLDQAMNEAMDILKLLNVG